MPHLTHKRDRAVAAGERETRAYALEIRATGDDGTVEGYGSVFGVKDSYDDIIVAGAFKASLAAHKQAGTMPAMLWQHDPAEPIGVWDDMSEDANGLKVRGRLALDTVKGREVHALLRMGALNGLSIGFVATAKTWNDKDGTRTISEIDLWEVSLVTFPANGKARVTGVKAFDVASITTIRQAEGALRDAGLPDDKAKAFIAAVKRIVSAERDARDAMAEATRAAERLLSTIKS